VTRKQKLELTWIGKENRPKLEPRILLEDPEKSCHAAHRITENDIFDNRLIFGDNLLALKSLEQEFTGRIKCIFIAGSGNSVRSDSGNSVRSSKRGSK
jgi:adenine-specific DNA-methyltransferase